MTVKVLNTNSTYYKRSVTGLLHSNTLWRKGAGWVLFLSGVSLSSFLSWLWPHGLTSCLYLSFRFPPPHGFAFVYQYLFPTSLSGFSFCFHPPQKILEEGDEILSLVEQTVCCLTGDGWGISKAFVHVTQTPGGAWPRTDSTALRPWPRTPAHGLIDEVPAFSGHCPGKNKAGWDVTTMLCQSEWHLNKQAAYVGVQDLGSARTRQNKSLGCLAVWSTVSE